MDTSNRKRSSPSNAHPWQRLQKDHRRNEYQHGPRTNQTQQAEQDYVSKEDEFALKQSKKKAKIRVNEGRAKPIDWLAVTLNAIDPISDPLEDEPGEDDLEIVDPAGFLESLEFLQLQEVSKDIEHYMVLETNSGNRRYWNVSKAVLYLCQDAKSFMRL